MKFKVTRFEYWKAYEELPPNKDEDIILNGEPVEEEEILRGDIVVPEKIEEITADMPFSEAYMLRNKLNEVIREINKDV